MKCYGVNDMTPKSYKATQLVTYLQLPFSKETDEFSWGLEEEKSTLKCPQTQCLKHYDTTTDY